MGLFIMIPACVYFLSNIFKMEKTFGEFFFNICAEYIHCVQGLFLGLSLSLLADGWVL